MAKGYKHLKHLKSEKAKVKLKAKKKELLPKGLNVTDTSVKVKKIMIRDQFKLYNETEIVSKRKLNIKDLLARLQHHNSTVRQEAVKELKDILLQHPLEILSSQLNLLLQRISALFFDKEKDIRRDSLKVLNCILNLISNEQLTPFCNVLITYLRCAMTHIDPNIKEDSLLFLDILIQHCNNIIVKDSHKILPNFLDMISRMHTETKPERQLTITLDSKNTTVKWRIKVLECLGNILRSIINYKKIEKAQHYTSAVKVICINKETKYIPFYRQVDIQDYKINFESITNLRNDTNERSLDVAEFIKYISVLIPLMFDSWIEVCPEERTVTSTISGTIISSETSILLKHIVIIIQLITEYIDILDYNDHINTKMWFTNSFQNVYTKKLFSKFPYTKTKTVEKFRKRQEDFSSLEMTEKCLEQNLGICQIYTWFTSMNINHITNKLDKTYCQYVMDYIYEIIDDWSDMNNFVLPQLNKLLRTLFFKASQVWYVNRITMESILKAMISASFHQSKKELQIQLHDIISDIILDHTLTGLQSEHIFKDFVSTLPTLLLHSCIHENIIQMINRAVLHHKEWIWNILVEKQDAIIDNAKIIEIIGSEDEERSRLMICNLFYFVNEQVFY
ncbi:testis-expressed sequence 10 protein [Vespula maculifrons]|uniref:Testis-expressed sequence 10 protein n=1 Tax=Vespula maculifrons TaxID=7453 RepID=A0ABD2CVL6_VESMC